MRQANNREQVLVPNSGKRMRFERLFMPHLNAAYNLACWLVRHPQDAEDMVQETYLKAYKAFDGFKGEKPLPWLLAILRNTCLTWLVRKSRHGKILDFDEALRDRALEHITDWTQDAPLEPDAVWLRDEEQNRVREALEELPELLRTIIVLREFEDLRYVQIAEILGVPVGTVMSRLSRARSHLKARLDKDSDKGQRNEL
jgi:RNA polymerase sigma-70 factor (ECF subfamily)